mmetsp:Transcript_13680/g.35317  ORF Transcript_13680/g.35317 Transcript_13680/m.35317 type:complete len:216 (-) Transcript_13680:1359-2006(-)
MRRLVVLPEHALVKGLGAHLSQPLVSQQRLDNRARVRIFVLDPIRGVVCLGQIRCRLHRSLQCEQVHKVEVFDPGLEVLLAEAVVKHPQVGPPVPLVEPALRPSCAMAAAAAAAAPTNPAKAVERAAGVHWPRTLHRHGGRHSSNNPTRAVANFLWVLGRDVCRDAGVDPADQPVEDLLLLAHHLPVCPPAEMSGRLLRQQQPRKRPRSAPHSSS